MTSQLVLSIDKLQFMRITIEWTLLSWSIADQTQIFTTGLVSFKQFRLFLRIITSPQNVINQKRPNFR